MSNRSSASSASCFSGHVRPAGGRTRKKSDLRPPEPESNQSSGPGPGARGLGFQSSRCRNVCSARGRDVPSDTILQPEPAAAGLLALDSDSSENRLSPWISLPEPGNPRRDRGPSHTPPPSRAIHTHPNPPFKRQPGGSGCLRELRDIAGLGVPERLSSW